MTIDAQFIQNDAIRADAEKLAEKYPAYVSQVFEKRQLTFHGWNEITKHWDTFSRAEVPSYALASDVSYWMAKDGKDSSAWWDICHILTAYEIRAAAAGKKYRDAPAAFNRAIADYGFSEDMVSNVLTSFENHISDIPYGVYLYNPSSVLSLIGGGSSSGGVSAGKVALGAAAVLGGLFLASKMGKKKRR